MIKVENLTKTFGTKRAVDGISFSVERGEVLGFLGPNGAGKSTTMRMITGFLPPSSGKITVGGFDIAENPIPAKKLIGYLPENAPAYTDMTVYGFLDFAAEIRGLRGDAKKSAINRVVDLCFLNSVLHQNVDTLSKGYRHRTCFAQSIIHDPDILVLDEPTDGLDPNQKHEIRQLIRSMGQKKAIIFSTHILEEVDAVCSRAMIIDRGKVVANGTPPELRRKSEWAGAVTLRVIGVATGVVQEKLSRLRSAKRVAVAQASRLSVPGAAQKTHGQDARATTAVTVTVFPRTADDGDLTREIIEATNGWQVEELRTEEGRLDEVFRSITMPDTVAKEPAK
jgi:ABC-2 type transport system ATP-binding protein